MVSFALGLTVAGLVARALLAPGSAAPRSVVQFEVNPPPMPVAFVPEGANPRSFAVSPDGTAVVYRGFRGGVPRLFLRSMADGDVRELRGTERVGVLTPFWSPDGDWIGFERGQGLERVPLEGGSPIAIAQVESQQLRSAAWGEDDSIVFARGNTLFRVSAGRRPEALFETAGAGWLDDVELLPGGNVALVSVVTFAVDADRTDLAAVVFGDEELRVLIEHAHNPHFLSSGHLVYATDDALWAVRFDPEELAIQGKPVRVRDNVRAQEFYAMADVDLARDGTLVYLSADLEQRDRRRLTWVDRAGRRDAAVPQVAPFATPRLSSDGEAVVVRYTEAMAGEDSEIWIYDLGGRPPRRLVSGKSTSLPTFSPDGRTVYFIAVDGGRPPDLYAIASDGSQTRPTPLLGEPYYPRHPLAVSPDGTELLFYANRGTVTGWDILALPLGGDGVPHTVVQSPAFDRHVEFSPDGRWIAYASSREGSEEVYVQPYPSGPAQRVSPAGGNAPLWSRSGDELFYRDGNALMTVAVGRDGPQLTFGAPQRLFEVEGWAAGTQGHSYDVAADGRFLLVEQDPAASGSRGRLTGVVNWGEELKRLVPID